MDKNVESLMKENQEQMEEAKRVLQPLIAEGFWSKKVAHAVIRAYHMVYPMIPIGQLTDKDLLSIRGIGPKSLAKVREIIPRPEEAIHGGS